MRVQVSAGIDPPPPLNTIDTVACDTPAAFATSFWVALDFVMSKSLIRISDTYQ
jgi:hypothetical protein